MQERCVVVRARHRQATRTSCAAVLLAWLEQRRNPRKALTLEEVRHGILELFSVPTIRMALQHLEDTGLVKIEPGDERGARYFTVLAQPERRAS